jgi:hypothetical protein
LRKLGVHSRTAAVALAAQLRQPAGGTLIFNQAQSSS